MATTAERHFNIGGVSWSFTLTYVPPSDAPGTLTDWREDLDFPGITVFFKGDFRFIYAHVERLHKFFQGEGHWGHDEPMYGRARTFRERTLHAAEEQAEAFIAELQAAMLALVNARASRLAQREATIARAHANHGLVTATDDGPAPAPGEPGFIGPLEAPRATVFEDKEGNVVFEDKTRAAGTAEPCGLHKADGFRVTSLTYTRR